MGVPACLQLSQNVNSHKLSTRSTRYFIERARATSGVTAKVNCVTASRFCTFKPSPPINLKGKTSPLGMISFAADGKGCVVHFESRVRGARGRFHDDELRRRWQKLPAFADASASATIFFTTSESFAIDDDAAALTASDTSRPVARKSSSTAYAAEMTSLTD